MTKPTFMILYIETLSNPQQTYIPITKPIFHLRIRKQPSTFVTVLLRELLPEIIDNNDITGVRFGTRGARENFDGLRKIWDNSNCQRISKNIPVTL
ncbi:hypothetical protein HOLleu_34213 [Holothuria leucospilota]|uniref:Uncharacterized protein n=1 Tax=Holothuria leucospilota TaxID=206669 RepID=A0A9Q1BIB3_HOLLE|nr:hypothetical protein HOLleu_34213 [Holothuria leucospilota]